VSTAFFSQAELEADISPHTTRRLLDHNGDGIVDVAAELQLRVDACAHISSIFRGPYAAVPSAADATPEEKRCARSWALGQLAVRFPEYFRFDGHKLCEQTDREAMRARAIEPAENKTHVRSDTVPSWGGWGECGC
jgi:hypothetical protein